MVWTVSLLSGLGWERSCVDNDVRRERRVWGSRPATICELFDVLTLEDRSECCSTRLRPVQHRFAAEVEQRVPVVALEVEQRRDLPRLDNLAPVSGRVHRGPAKIAQVERVRGVMPKLE